MHSKLEICRQCRMLLRYVDRWRGLSMKSRYISEISILWYKPNSVLNNNIKMQSKLELAEVQRRNAPSRMKRFFQRRSGVETGGDTSLPTNMNEKEFSSIADQQDVRKGYYSVLWRVSLKLDAGKLILPDKRVISESDDLKTKNMCKILSQSINSANDLIFSNKRTPSNEPRFGLCCS